MKKALVFLMSLLGFAVVSCDKPNFVCEYGCPYAEFDVKGLVTDEENHPIENIQIVINDNDTLYTDAEGKYSTLPQMIYPWDSVQVKAIDIDGNDHGGDFVAASKKIGFSSDEFKGGDGNWYEGNVTKEINFQLKKKE